MPVDTPVASPRRLQTPYAHATPPVQPPRPPALPRRPSIELPDRGCQAGRDEPAPEAFNLLQFFRVRRAMPPRLPQRW